jgi:hypothetical protein
MSPYRNMMLETLKKKLRMLKPEKSHFEVTPRSPGGLERQSLAYDQMAFCIKEAIEANGYIIYCDMRGI